MVILWHGHTSDNLRGLYGSSDSHIAWGRRHSKCSGHEFYKSTQWVKGSKEAKVGRERCWVVIWTEKTQSTGIKQYFKVKPHVELDCPSILYPHFHLWSTQKDATVREADFYSGATLKRLRAGAVCCIINPAIEAKCSSLNGVILVQPSFVPLRSTSLFREQHLHHSVKSFFLGET